ncbi:TetR/AcrR family transcriptional regulator [Aliiroseovarius sediminis]|uniref:TetR/AcrR family transcriptional regulator n=1 Tax=Aliiroseovarius sediminis TaxID=2925839 RepID=UPI001F5A38F0|nr:TetR/AcrR family transcriptional regulator [uncultured Aliiroseovarius sp.]MCI2395662.1 TetR/AcrR family transcriptional regulator [Aliiroseovarius sediminis]
MKTRKPSGDRKAEILAATLDLAFEVGPDHVTTGQIAGRLGLTQPAIYKHYPRKEDIWIAIADSVVKRIAQNTALAANSEKPSADLLRDMVLAHLHLVRDHPALPEIMVTRDPTGRLAQTRQRVLEAMTEFHNALVLCCDRLRLAGQLRSNLTPDDCATLLVGLIQSLVLRLILTRDTGHLVQDGTRLLDLQLSLFEPEGSQP